MKPKKLFLTVAEYAKETGLKRKTVYQWVEAGQLAYKRSMGKQSRIYIPVSEVPTDIRIAKQERI